MRYDFKNTHILEFINDKLQMNEQFLKSVGLLDWVINHNNHKVIYYAILKVYDDERDTEEMQKHFINYINVVRKKA